MFKSSLKRLIRQYNDGRWFFLPENKHITLLKKFAKTLSANANEISYDSFIAFVDARRNNGKKIPGDFFSESYLNSKKKSAAIFREFIQLSKPQSWDDPNVIEENPQIELYSMDAKRQQLDQKIWEILCNKDIPVNRNLTKKHVATTVSQEWLRARQYNFTPPRNSELYNVFFNNPAIKNPELKNLLNQYKNIIDKLDEKECLDGKSSLITPFVKGGRRA